LKTIEEGIHTKDVFNDKISKKCVTTSEFTEAVINNLGKIPSTLPSVSFKKDTPLNLPKYVRKEAAKKELEGVDIFVHWNAGDPKEMGSMMKQLETPEIFLKMITNRGIKVWPEGFEETFCTDHWRCRFKSSEGYSFSKAKIADLLIKANELGIDTIKTENLYAFDGIPSYSLGQGQ